MKKLIAIALLSLAAACSHAGHHGHHHANKCHCTKCECSAECCKNCGDVCQCNHDGNKADANGEQCHKAQ
jgi:hypothetical protein